jgi:hypothetical protein
MVETGTHGATWEVLVWRDDLSPGAWWRPKIRLPDQTAAEQTIEYLRERFDAHMVATTTDCLDAGWLPPAPE